MTKPQYSSGGYTRQRSALLNSVEGQFCVHCGAPATEADHQPPISLHPPPGHIPGTGCCVLVASCFRCARRQGGLLAMPARVATDMLIVEPDGFGVEDRVWDVPWLDDLRDVPESGTWPRLMTVPHPRAVGSLGFEVEAWALEQRGRPWRWWQRLAARRLLEVDGDGCLVWETAILTVARQVGKTWWLADICGWRMHAAERFGVAQTVLSTGKDVAVVKEMQRPFRMAAKAVGFPYKSREVNGQEMVELLSDGSRWLVRAKESVYGHSADLVSVDEAWKVQAAIVDEGIIPVMIEREQTQLLLVSTAHRKATALMIGRRATALDELGSPDDDSALLLEWSAPRSSAREDVATWRQASPHWSAKRERWIASRLTAALSGESDDVDEPDPVEAFDCQYLNRWPAKRLAVVKGELVVEPSVWEAARCDVDSVGPLVIGVEDHVGQGVAVAVCGTLPDGRLVVGGAEFTNRDDAYVMVAEAAGDRPGSSLVVGASLVADPELAMIPVLSLRKATHGETAAAFAGLRDLLATGRVTQDGSPALTGQLYSARVTVGVSGLSLIPRTRSDLLKAAVWAVRDAATQMLEPAIH